MSLAHLFGQYHLACLSVFAPQSAVAQSMRSSPEIDPRWPPSSPPLDKKLLKRSFDFAGCIIEIPGRIAWNIPSANDDWHRVFYNFSWMQEVAVSNNQKLASSFVREFINSFITEAWDMRPFTKDADIVGSRLAHWLYYRTFITKGSSKVFRKRMGKSLINHARLLAKKLRSEPENFGLPATWGLISAAIDIKDMRFLLPDACAHLTELLHREILPDGTHVSGCPQRHLEALKILIDIHALLPESSPLYGTLTKTIRHMGSMLRFFCHGDGRLALFNGGLMDDAARIAQAIELSGSILDLPLEAEHSGFFRLEREKTTAIIKSTGQREARNPQAHRGWVAFEFSDGSERFVVNCGAYRGTDANWQKASPMPQAHSTLSFDVPEDDRYIPTLPAEQNSQQDSGIATNLTSGQDMQGIFVECASDAYFASCNIRHRRYLRLSKDGQLLSGRDFISNEANDASAPPKAQLRFHLHPDIRCRKEKDGTLQLTSVSGNTWVFAAESPHEAHIEESVYLGYYGRPQKTLQIVITPILKADKVTVSWSFKKN